MRHPSLLPAAAVAVAALLVQPLTAVPVAAAEEGTVLAWGRDFAGQLGDGLPHADQPAPVGVQGLGAGSQVVDVAAGLNHNLALRADGSVLAWGQNSSGQVGDGSVQNRSAPVTVMGPESHVVGITAGFGRSLALRSDGGILGWGFDGTGPQPQPTSERGFESGSRVIAVSAGGEHHLALSSDGVVVGWGYNQDGQVGDGAILPGPINTGLSVVRGLDVGSRVVAVSAGGRHSLALRADGSVWAWGSDDQGQLGDGGSLPGPSRSTPVAVQGLGPGSGVVAVVAGAWHSLALLGDGSVLAWGSDIMGALGDGDPIASQPAPRPVSGLGPGSGVVALAGGWRHSLALRSDRSVLAWGDDGFGQLGDGGALPGDPQTRPVVVSGLGVGSPMVELAAGGSHSLAASVGGQRGHVTVEADGGVATLGMARFWGSTAGRRLNRPIVGMDHTPSTFGYWLVGADGGVFGFGDARFFGSTGGVPLNRPVVGLQSTPSGNGYWLVAADGGVFAYGDAGFFGSTGGVTLNRPIVGMERTPSGKGYWLVASDGGVFAFGDARFLGSTGGSGSTSLNSPVVAMARTSSGGGYHLVGSDGGVFAFGDAAFRGSAGGTPLAAPVVGIMPATRGTGYVLCAGDGGFFRFGDAPYWGSMAASGSPKSVVGCEAPAPPEP